MFYKKKLVLILSIICILSSFTMVNALTSIPLMDTDIPPIIDGVFTPGEWQNHQIFIQNNTLVNGYISIETYAYFVNDENNLYVMVDATGDPTNNTEDICLLVFHKEGVRRDIKIVGGNGTTLTNDFNASIGYGPSPNYPNNHKIYEFCIPLEYLNANPGEEIDFCSPMDGKHGSMPYDATYDYNSSSYRDNVYPPGLNVEQLWTWDEVEISEKPEIPEPVGGALIGRKNNLLSLSTLLMISIMVLIVNNEHKFIPSFH